MQATLDVVAIRQVTGRCRIDSARRFRTVKPFFCAVRCCPRGVSAELTSGPSVEGSVNWHLVFIWRASAGGLEFQALWFCGNSS